MILNEPERCLRDNLYGKNHIRYNQWNEPSMHLKRRQSTKFKNQILKYDEIKSGDLCEQFSSHATISSFTNANLLIIELSTMKLENQKLNNKTT